MSDYHKGTRLKLTELREYQSDRTGRTYFAGYLGGNRIVMLRDDRAECTGKETARWTVFLEEAPTRDQTKAAPPAVTTKRRRKASESKGPELNLTQARTAADRRAEAAMRDRGLDPHAPMSSDPIPF